MQTIGHKHLNNCIYFEFSIVLEAFINICMYVDLIKLYLFDLSILRGWFGLFRVIYPDSNLPAVCQQIDGRVCQESAGFAGSCGAACVRIRIRFCRQTLPSKDCRQIDGRFAAGPAARLTHPTAPSEGHNC